MLGSKNEVKSARKHKGIFLLFWSCFKSSKRDSLIINIYKIECDMHWGHCASEIKDFLSLCSNARSTMQ